MAGRRITDRAGVAEYLATTDRNIRHLMETRRIPENTTEAAS